MVPFAFFSTQAVISPAQALVNSLLAYSPKLLLLADIGTGGGTVSSWQDQSGNTYNATAGNAPSFTGSVLNGRAVVRFDGTSNVLMTSVPLVGGNTVYVVTKSRTTSGVGRLFSLGAGESSHSFGPFGAAIGGAANTWAYYVASGGTGGVLGGNITTFQILTVTLSNTALYGRVNGGVQVSLGSDSSALPMTGLYLGSDNSNESAAVDVACFIVAPDNTHDGQINSLLGNYYGITLSP